MYIKKIRHICDVRGCKNTDTFAVSRTREMGNSIILCKQCANEISEAIDQYNPEQDKKKSFKAPPKLFYNTEPSVEIPPEDSNNNIEQTVYHCNVCGKDYKSEKRYSEHIKTHELSN